MPAPRLPRSGTAQALLCAALWLGTLPVQAADAQRQRPEMLWVTVQAAARPDAQLLRLQLDADGARAWLREQGQIRVYAVDPVSATLLGPVHSPGRRLAQWWAGAPVAVPAGLLVLLYAVFCWGWVRRTGPASVDEDQALWVLHASQTGTALALAQRSAEQLRAAGLAVRLAALAELSPAQLAGLPRALFVVSTCGDGEAPDDARVFERRHLARAARLPQLHYGLLALGDRRYARFCAFGQRLQGWLDGAGAHALFPALQVDAGDPAVLRRWHTQLEALGAAPAANQEVSSPAWEPWTLAARRLANPGSAGGPCYLLDLLPQAGSLTQWSAGDLVDIQPEQAPQRVADWLHAAGLDAEQRLADGRPLRAHLARSELPPVVAGLQAEAVAAQLQPLTARCYSIASLPADGGLHLLVRLEQDAQGRLGLGSSWLCRHAQLGQPLALRVRANPGFHPPADSTLPLLLIGNGTGLAGLRAHWRHRAAQRGAPIWLIAGERNAAHDDLYADELAELQAQGVLDRLDRAWSRDAGQLRYVQDCLLAQAQRLRSWMARGAVIHVCGSASGMAPAVDAVLTQVLGSETLALLAQQGRYRRDVY